MHYELCIILNIKAEVHDVAVLHYVFLSFNAELASFLDSGFRFVLHVVVVLDDLCADESLLEVGVDDSGTLWGFPSLLECPCLYLHLACRDECLEIEQSVCLLDETVDTALFQSEFFEEELLVLVAVEASYVLFRLGCYHH